MKWIKEFEWLLNHKNDFSLILGTDLDIYVSDYSFIYGIQNIVNEMWYIGRTKSIWQRLFNGRGKDGHVEMILNNDSRTFITNYKEFRFVIFEYYKTSDITNEFISDREKFYVTKYNSFINGYNKTLSGDLNEGSQTRGRKVYTNIVTGEVRYLTDDQLNDLGENNFIHGRVNNIGKYWYRSPDGLFESYFIEGSQPDGWVLGRKKGMGGDNNRGRWCISFTWNTCEFYRPKDLYLELINKPESELRFCKPDEFNWYELDKYKNLPLVTIDQAIQLLNEVEMMELNLIN